MHSPNDSPNDSPRRQPLTLTLPDEVATLALGAALAPLLTPGMVIWLDGDLGSGKTTLARSLLRSRGHSGPVKSPTYTLVEVYVISSIYWYHFDFYRFNKPEEFDDAGLAEYFRDDCVCLVEWPGKAAGHVPPADLVLAFRFAADAGASSEVGESGYTGRRVDVTADSAAGQKCLSALQNRWPAAAN